jgi:hypothetical protein
MATANTWATYGGYFASKSTSVIGVRGHAYATTGTNYGVYSKGNMACNIQNHRLDSTDGMRHLGRLFVRESRPDRKDEEMCVCRVVDPVLGRWLRKQTVERIWTKGGSYVAHKKTFFGGSILLPIPGRFFHR